MSSNGTSSFRIRRYELTGGVDPISVVTPIPCNFLSWRNLGLFSILVSTHPWNDSSYDTLGPAAEDLMVVLPSGPPEIHPRFRSDLEIFRLKLDSDQSGDKGVVVVKFVF